MAYNYNVRSRFIAPQNPFTKSRFDLPDNAFQVKRPKYVNPFGRDYNQESETSPTDIPYQPTNKIPYDPESLDYIKQQVGDVQNQVQKNKIPDDLYEPESFSDAYGRLSKDRPRRLAYQEAVNQGPEQIKRSKWMKVLAGVGGGAAAFGGEPGGQAGERFAKLYQAPQERANQRYREKIAELGRLSNMEDNDFQDRLKALEMDRGDMWKAKTYGMDQEKLGIEKRDAAIREADLSNRTRYTNAQIDQIKEEIRKSKTRTWTDTTKGITYEETPEGKIIERKTGSSTAEKVKEAGDTAGSVAKAEEPYKLAHDNRLAQAGIDEAFIQSNSREEVAAGNRQSRIDLAVTKGRLAAEKEPDKARKAVINYVSDMIARGQLPSDALDYVRVNETNGGLYSDGANQTTKQLVNDAIEASYKQSGVSSATGSGVTKGGTRFSVTPKGGGGGF